MLFVGLVVLVRRVSRKTVRRVEPIFCATREKWQNLYFYIFKILLRQNRKCFLKSHFRKHFEFRPCQNSCQILIPSSELGMPPFHSLTLATGVCRCSTFLLWVFCCVKLNFYQQKPFFVVFCCVNLLIKFAVLIPNLHFFQFKIHLQKEM